MRLLDTSTLALREFVGDKIPYYAILSHRWEDEEVTFLDVQREKGPAMEGWAKVVGCCAKAAADGWKYVWIDSCCIDKSSSAELSEAINSMFHWYRGAQVCYAYLSDVEVPLGETLPPYAVERSHWFRRGWTLQELLAPRWVEFFDRNWTSIGTKSSLREIIERATKIDAAYLFEFEKASVAKRMSWAAGRETTRIEDQAYCLLGIFGVNMPPLYGEGRNAFQRLQLEILSKIDDDSLFAWSGKTSGGMLAPSTSQFAASGNISARKSLNSQIPMVMTNKGLRIEAAIIPAHAEEHLSVTNSSDLLVLNCVRDGEAFDRTIYVGVSLYRSPGGVWKRGTHLQRYENGVGSSKVKGELPPTTVYIPQPSESKAFLGPNVWVDFQALSNLGLRLDTSYFEGSSYWEASGSMLVLQQKYLRTRAVGVVFKGDLNILALVISVSESQTRIKLSMLRDSTHGAGLHLSSTDIIRHFESLVRKVATERGDHGDETSLVFRNQKLITAKLSKTQREGEPVELIILTAQNLLSNETLLGIRARDSS